MRSLASHENITDLLIPDTDAIVGHNPDEETGCLGTSNYDLNPHMTAYDCRSVLTVTENDFSRRRVLVPESYFPVVEDTLHFLRDRIGISGLLPDSSLVPVDMQDRETLTSAFLRSLRDGISSVSEGAGYSYVLYSPQIEELHRERPDLRIPGNLAVSEFFNNKVLATFVCSSARIPIPETSFAFSLSDARESVRGFAHRFGFPLILKGARSASGHGTFVIRSLDECDACLLFLLPYFQEGVSPVPGFTPERKTGIVVQRFIEHIDGSPAATILIGETDADHRLLGITEQILDSGLSHNGNRYPAGDYLTPVVRSAIVESMEKAACYAQRCGGAGMILSADFIVSAGKPYLVEFNMRMPAHFGALAMVHHVLGSTEPQDRQYLFKSFPLRQCLDSPEKREKYFSTLQDDGFAFSPARRDGFIPLNLAVPQRVQGLIISSSQKMLSLLEECISNI